MYRHLASALFALLCMVLYIEAIRGTKHERTLGLVLLLFDFAGTIYITILRGGRTNLGGFSFRFPPPFLNALLTHHYGLAANRSLLNMLLFVPFGCLLPYNISLWRSDKGDRIVQFKTILLCGLLVSLTIEICQLVFKVGVFEVDDLVKNTMGTGLGYVFFLILSRRVFKNDK